MYAWPPNLIPQVMQSAECSWGTSRVSSRYIDWWYCIGTLKVVGVGGHGSMEYACDAGFHCGHQGVLQGVQIGGIVLAPCQHLPGRWGWWVGVVYIQLMQGLHEGCINEAMYYEKFQNVISLAVI